MDEVVKGLIVGTLVPRNLLLGSKLGAWYNRNPYHRFDEGDVLILRSRNLFGYGIRPVAVVEDYKIRDFGFGEEGKYSLTMYMDAEFVPEYSERGLVIDNRWWRHNEVIQCVERTVNEHELHFKWNIENQFKKVQARTVDDALVLYASREVRQKRVA